MLEVQRQQVPVQEVKVSRGSNQSRAASPARSPYTPAELCWLPDHEAAGTQASQALLIPVSQAQRGSKASTNLQPSSAQDTMSAWDSSLASSYLQALPTSAQTASWRALSISRGHKPPARGVRGTPRHPMLAEAHVLVRKAGTRLSWPWL